MLCSFDAEEDPRWPWIRTLRWVASDAWQRAGQAIRRTHIIGRYLKISEVLDYATLPTILQLAEGQ